MKCKNNYLRSLFATLIFFSLIAGVFSTATTSSRSPHLSSETPRNDQGQSEPVVPRETGKTRQTQSYDSLPMSFEANYGQTNSRVKFLSRTGGFNVFLSPTEAVLVTRRGVGSPGKPQSQIGKTSSLRPLRANAPASVLRMRLVAVSAETKISGLDELPGKTNYLIGNDPRAWRQQIPTYAKVKCQEVYPGVDLVYYGNQRQLEYDFVVAPGSDPAIIRLEFIGAQKIGVDSAGDLVLHTGDGEIRQQKPIIYQDIDGLKQKISGGYVLTAHNQVGFELGSYDAARPLIIDPTLVYSTYLGGSGGDIGNGIAVDAFGNAYITGSTDSINFPTQPGAFRFTISGGVDAFVTKINPTGTALVYSTYLGGGSFDEGQGIALDSGQNAYVTGSTSSADFPTLNALQSTLRGGGDAFTTKLNPTGSALIYSTYLGGAKFENNVLFGKGAIAADNSGNAYVAGFTDSLDFPVTPSAFQSSFGGTLDAFVTKLNTAASGTAALAYSTYLGGSNFEDAHGIAVDSFGNAYVTGFLRSTDFKTTTGAFQPAKGAGGVVASDAYLVKLNTAAFGAASLTYSTYLGGSGSDGGDAIAIDASGNAYLTGFTQSPDFPHTSTAFQTSLKGMEDAFVTKLSPRGAGPADLVYSTYIGGEAFFGGLDFGKGIAVDSSGDAYVTGFTGSTDFPLQDPLQASRRGLTDAFVAKLNATGSALVYSSYLGGDAEENGIQNLTTGEVAVEAGAIAVDSSGSAYVTGWTRSGNFRVTSGALLTAYQGGVFDAFVAKISSPRGPCLSLLERITVPVDGSTVFSKSVLEAGITYRLRASGSFFIGGPGFADAEYAFNGSLLTVIDHCFGLPSEVDIGIGVDDALVDDVKSPFWGAFNPSHVYQADVLGLSERIALNYHDCFYPDNSGFLTVEVFRLDDFDTCLTDDTTGDVLRFNSRTGGYSFSKAGPGGVTITGSGTARLADTAGCSLRLTDTDSGTNAFAIDLRALVDLCRRSGSATIKLVPGETFTITDSNIDDSLCICR